MKLEFRKKWAQQQLTIVKESRTSARKWAEVDVTKGTYQFDATGAVARAGRYATKCIKMGGKWTTTNSMTEAMEFLEIQRSSVETFERSWSQFKQEMKVGKQAPVENADKGRSTQDRSVARSRSPRTSAAEAKAKPASKPKPDAKLQENLMMADKLKKFYHETTSLAHSLVARIESGDDTWSWANNDGNVGNLRLALSTLQDRLSDFDKEYLIAESKDLKTKYGAVHVTVNLENFLTLEPDMQVVSRGYKRVMSRHSAGSNVS